MSLPECFAVMNNVERVLDTASGSTEARRLLAAGASIPDFVEAFARFAEPEHAEALRSEISELPENTIAMILQAWLLAEAAGKPLTLRSVTPERPLEAARARRVRMAISIDEAGVDVALSHIPGRHAGWYAPAVRVA